jgi:hypothetical protein
MTVGQHMDQAVLRIAAALGIRLPNKNPFHEPGLRNGPNLVATGHVSEEDYWRLYWSAIHYIETGDLP